MDQKPLDIRQFFMDEALEAQAKKADSSQEELADISDNQLDKSLEVLRDILQQFKEEQIALSFNGGKDCTVALHLMRALCAQIDADDPVIENRGRFQRINYVHFVKNNEFEEIEQFRLKIEKMYGIKVQLFSQDFKSEVQRLIDEKDIKAIIMGNRRTDPYSQNLDYICASSEGWPQFIRVFPILHWNYKEVWQFLRANQLTYCHLYDQGYTSLGEKHNTQKNPRLLINNEGEETLDKDGNKIEIFKPAYALENDDHERFSRRDANKTN